MRLLIYVTLVIMSEIIKTIEVQDEREAEKILKADVCGIRSRQVASDVTIDNIGTDSFKLREGDDRDAIISAIRDKVTEMSQKEVCPKTVDFRITAFKGQYEALSGADRTYNGEVRSWQEVLNAIPNMPDFLTGVESLEQAQVYFLNEQGQLLVGDGCAEPLEKTLGWNYHKSRTEATRISYVDSEGKIVVVDDDDTEIPSEAEVISERGLITLKECGRVNKGQFEKAKYIWTESGKTPSRARFACWGYVSVFWRANRYSGAGNDDRGSRRVLKVNLNFES